MTIRFETETTINRPNDEVFDRLVNISNYSDWLPQEGIFVSTRQLSDGPVGLGTTYKDKTTLGAFHGEIIAFERPTNVVFRHRMHWLGIPVMETCPGYVLSSVDDGTRVRHVAAGQMFGLFKVMTPQAIRIAACERQRTVNALKKSMEFTSH